MPAQSVWEFVVVVLVPVLVMGTALLMERVERHTLGTADKRYGAGGSPMVMASAEDAPGSGLVRTRVGG